MNSVSGSILLVLLVVVCFGSRRWALLGVMGGVFFLTQGAAIDVAGMNLWGIRVLEAAAFARVVLRGELAWSRLNRIDATLLLAYNYAAAVWILRSSDVSFRHYASAVDPTLCYLALRGLIGSLEDLRWFLAAFVVLLVPFTGLVVLERQTGQSPFAVLGATGELMFRNGIPRCRGSFRHAILLGSVAAAFVPLYIGLFFAGYRRVLALIGVALCLTLVALSNSGGPLTSAAAGLVGWSLWQMRRRLLLVQGLAVAAFLFLLFFMQAPIWYLPFKISSVVGGTGYHRGVLMDRAWQNLDRWWFAGMPIEETALWVPYSNAVVGGADITNQYLAFGIRGGLLALVLFVVALALTFKAIGRMLVSARASREGCRDEFLLWGLGVALFVHVVSWLGVSYFDQSYVVWLTHLAMISGAIQPSNPLPDQPQASVTASLPTAFRPLARCRSATPA